MKVAIVSSSIIAKHGRMDAGFYLGDTSEQDKTIKNAVKAIKDATKRLENALKEKDEILQRAEQMRQSGEVKSSAKFAGKNWSK